MNKMIKKLNFGLGILATSLFMSSNHSHAFDGGSNGGGGDIIRFPDGSASIADPALSVTGLQPGGLPPIRALSPKLYYTIGQAVSFLETLDQGDSCPNSNAKCQVFDTLNNLYKKPDSIRVFVVQNVDELGQYCAAGAGKTYTLPTGGKIERAACTSGQVQNFHLTDPPNFQ